MEKKKGHGTDAQVAASLAHPAASDVGAVAVLLCLCIPTYLKWNKFFILFYFILWRTNINQEKKRDNQYAGSVLAVYHNYTKAHESKNYSKLEKEWPLI